MPRPAESWEEEHFEALVRNGIAAAREGDRERARRLLEQATRIKISDPRPWIWLSATTDDLEEQRQYLGRAIAAEPGNAAARRGLELLSEKLEKSRRSSEETKAKSLQSEPGVDEYAQTHDQAGDPNRLTPHESRWMDAQQRLNCQRCGAVNLLPPAQEADRCILCGSKHLAVATEGSELVEPQAIIRMKLTEEQARRQLKRWVSQGWTVPDNLAALISKLKLRPVFLPYWAFAGTLEVGWRCEVNESARGTPRWVPRSGTETELYEGILIPGLQSMTLGDSSAVEPFDLKEAVEFTPEHLAGSAVLGFDRGLEAASRNAREKVISDFRKNLSHRVEAGYEKRDLTTSGGKWSDLTYKYLYLPIWVGNLAYRGKDFRLLVNGQSGKVGGKKPRDFSKIWLMVASVLAFIVFLIIIFSLLSTG